VQYILVLSINCGGWWVVVVGGRCDQPTLKNCGLKGTSHTLSQKKYQKQKRAF